MSIDILEGAITVQIRTRRNDLFSSCHQGEIREVARKTINLNTLITYYYTRMLYYYTPSRRNSAVMILFSKRPNPNIRIVIYVGNTIIIKILNNNFLVIVKY